MLLENLFCNPFKTSPTLILLANILEHFVTYKDPRLTIVMLDYISRTPSAPLYPSDIICYYYSKTESTTAKYDQLIILAKELSRAKESRSSKYMPRIVWDYSKLPSIGVDSSGSWLECILSYLVMSNNKDIHLASIRLLRCIL